MGNLIGREIVLTRMWIDPTAPEPAIDLDYKFTYPVTVFDAVMTDMTDKAMTLKQVLNVINDSIESKQPKIPAGPTNNVMMWTNKEGQIGKLPVERTFTADPASRSHSKLLTEAAIGAVLDLKTPLIAFNQHVADVIPGNIRSHMTDEERTYWNGMTPLQTFLMHAQDNARHLLPGEKETLMDKVDRAEFNAHVNDTKNPHRVTAAQVGTYTSKEIRSLIEAVEPKFFNYKNIVWDFLVDPPEFSLGDFQPENWDPTFIYDYHYNQDYYGLTEIEVDGKTYPISDTKLLPAVDPYTRYFALVPKYPPEVESRDGIVQIYFHDVAQPWAKVAEVPIKNGDLFITYPSRKLYLLIYNAFVEVQTSIFINPD